MTCLEFRRAALLARGPLPAPLAGHALACRCCADFLRSCEALEAELAAAVRVDPPAGLADRIVVAGLARVAPRRWLRYAAAAGLAAAVAAAALVRQDAAPSGDLALAGINHVVAEPQSFTTDNAGDPHLGARTLAALGVAVPPRLGVTRYVERCRYAGMTVQHFVFHGEMGDVTVLVPEAPVATPPATMTMAHGMTAIVLPTASGFITVVSDTGEAVDALQRTWSQRRRADNAQRVERDA